MKTEKTQFDFDGGFNYQRALPRRPDPEFRGSHSRQLCCPRFPSPRRPGFVNLSDTGSYRVNFDLATVTALKKWLAWRVAISDRFLSNPVEGNQRNDLLISTGLRLTFTK